jgi:hypothetical protein
MAKYRTIKLKSYNNVQEEHIAVSAITPGHLLTLNSDDKVLPHSVAGGNAYPMFALEDVYQGKTIADAFSADDPVQCWIPGRGDMVNAILKDGENVVIGDYLESAGDGTLQKHVADVDSSADITTIYPLQIVGQVVEAVDLSGSSGTHPVTELRVKIRIV